MKVAFTTDYYWPHMTGGVEHVVQEVATRIALRGHEVSVYTLAEPGSKPGTAVVDGVNVVRLPGIDLAGVLGLNVRVALGAKFARGLGAYDVVHAHNLFFTTSMAAAVRHPDRTVFTMHLAALRGAGLRMAAGAVFQALYASRVARRARAVTGVSQAVAWHALKLGVEAERLHVIPNAVDAARFVPNGHHRAKRLVYVGRLVANKGPQILLQALPEIFERHPDATLDVVGEGPASFCLTWPQNGRSGRSNLGQSNTRAPRQRLSRPGVGDQRSWLGLVWRPG